MAYTTDLKPAWPTPFWTIPPDLQSWRRASRIVGGGPVWTPVTVDVTTNTVYFGTGSGTPVYFPSLRPGNNPRAASLIAVDLSTGKLKWWQQLIERDQWEYDVAQPPLVYNGKIGGQTRRIVSVATKEGVWYAFDARSGRPFHERVKVLDRVEHPPLKPGQPVTVFPGSIGGLNYSPAAYDPKTNFVFNAAAETAGILIQQKLTPTQKKRKFLLGDIFLGLENGNFGQYLPGWKDHGSISAINVSTGRRVWKVYDAGAGAGRGQRDREWSRVCRRWRRCPSRVRAEDGEDPLDLPDRPSDRRRPDDLLGGREAVRRDHRRRHPDLVERRPCLPAPGVLARWEQDRVSEAAEPHRPSGIGSHRGRGRRPRIGRARTAPPRVRRARISIPRGALTLALWNPNSSNLRDVTGRVTLGGRPVSGAAIAVDRYVLPRRTGADGQLHRERRHDTCAATPDHGRGCRAGARVGGRPLSAAEQASLRAASGGINVGYRLVDVRAGRGEREHRPRHGSRRPRRRCARSAGRPALVPSQRDDHERRRAARSRARTSSRERTTATSGRSRSRRTREVAMSPSSRPPT